MTNAEFNHEMIHGSAAWLAIIAGMATSPYWHPHPWRTAAFHGVTITIIVLLFGVFFGFIPRIGQEDYLDNDIARLTGTLVAAAALGSFGHVLRKVPFKRQR